jgi:hypothetical protein
VVTLELSLICTCETGGDFGWLWSRLASFARANSGILPLADGLLKLGKLLIRISVELRLESPQHHHIILRGWHEDVVSLSIQEVSSEAVNPSVLEAETRINLDLILVLWTHMVEVIHLISVLALLGLVVDDRWLRLAFPLPLLLFCGLFKSLHQHDWSVLDCKLIHLVWEPYSLSEGDESHWLSKLLQLHLYDSSLQILFLYLLVSLKDPRALRFLPCLHLCTQFLKRL